MKNFILELNAKYFCYIIASIYPNTKVSFLSERHFISPGYEFSLNETLSILSISRTMVNWNFSLNGTDFCSLLNFPFQQKIFF